MILSFSITNFGSIKDTQTLDFTCNSDTTLSEYYCHEVLPGVKVRRLTLLYGPNASGKSTVLNAFTFLKNLTISPLSKKDEIIHYQPFLLDENTKNETSSLILSFVIQGIKYEYEIHFNRQQIIEEKLSYYPNHRIAEVYHRKTENGISSIRYGKALKINARHKIFLEGNLLPNNSLLGAFMKANIEAETLNIVANYFYSRLAPNIAPKSDNLHIVTNNFLQGNREDYEQLMSWLKKADFQIVDVIFEEEEDKEKMNSDIQTIYDNTSLETDKKSILKSIEDGSIYKLFKKVIFKHQIVNNGKIEKHDLPFDLESSGTLRHYGLLSALFYLYKHGSFRTIDEIETSLHPDLMKHFLLTFLVHAQKESQLLITTHNYFFLDDEDIFRKDAIWFTEKQANGATEIFSLADFDSQTFRKSKSILNLYKIGKLGAKPQLSSIF